MALRSSGVDVWFIFLRKVLPLVCCAEAVVQDNSSPCYGLPPGEDCGAGAGAGADIPDRPEGVKLCRNQFKRQDFIKRTGRNFLVVRTLA